MAYVEGVNLRTPEQTCESSQKSYLIFGPIGQPSASRPPSRHSLDIVRYPLAPTMHFDLQGPFTQSDQAGPEPLPVDGGAGLGFDDDEGRYNP